jgi:putative salt-induced outer membrane protein YdiY
VHKLTFLAVSLFGFLCCRALADQISLKNGDKLTGIIVKSDGKTLVLHTDYAGDVTLKWDAVQGIESAEDLHVELQDGKTVVGAVTTSDDTLVVATKTAGAVSSPRASVKSLRNDAEQAAYEKTVHPGLLQDWKAGLNVGFALTGGNSQTRNLSLAFIGTRQTLRDKLGVYSNAVYATNNAPGAVPATTANTIGGGLRYDHDITKRIFGFAAGDFFSDALQGLNLRSVFGGGAGYHAIKEDHTTLDLLGGLNYTRESYTALTRNFAALTLGEELMHKLGKTTVLNERLYLFPDLNSPGDFRGTFDFGTTTKMSKWLGWQNSFSDVYVTNPPPLKKQNDVIFTTGLNVSFGQ